jgi:uncharacterized protein (DUF433 family)
VSKIANLLDRISIDPAVCGGKPCIKGTRIWVSLVLDLLATGMTEAELRAEYPALMHEDILAAIAYGAEYRLLNDPRFLKRIEAARKSARAGNVIRLEDVEW